VIPLKVQVGPHQISIHQGQTVLVGEPDGQIHWPSEKGLYFFDTRVSSSGSLTKLQPRFHALGQEGVVPQPRRRRLMRLLECSLVSCPADAGADIRFHAGGCDRALVSADLSEDVRMRSLVKLRMLARQSMFEAQQAVFQSR
jgi:hypothetical protein